MKAYKKIIFNDVFFQRCLFFIILLQLTVLYNRVILDMRADEGYYLQFITESHSFFDYIKGTYLTLNGRVVPNTIAYIFLKYNLMFCWRVISIASILFIAYNIVTSFGVFDIRYFNITMLLVFCIGFRVWSSSFLWFIGAIFYLWPISLLTYLLRIILKKFLQNYQPPNSCLEMLISTIVGIFITLWSEQLACVLICSYTAYYCYDKFLKKNEIGFRILKQIILWTSCFLILLMAPSQRIRMNNTTDYLGLKGGFLYFLKNILYWTYHVVFMEQRFLIILLGIIVIMCYKKQNEKSCLELILPFSFIALFFNETDFSTFADISKYVYRFEYLSLKNINLKLLFPYIYWTIYTILLLISLFHIIKTQKEILAIFLIITASICSLGMMWFSPTLYLSGSRTSSFFSIGLISVIAFLIMKSNLHDYTAINCIGWCNILCLTIYYIKNGFVIFY